MAALAAEVVLLAAAAAAAAAAQLAEGILRGLCLSGSCSTRASGGAVRPVGCSTTLPSLALRAAAPPPRISRPGVPRAAPHCWACTRPSLPGAGEARRAGHATCSLCA